MLFGCCALANGSANAVKGGTGVRGQSVSEVGACTREERELAVQQVLPLYHIGIGPLLHLKRRDTLVGAQAPRARCLWNASMSGHGLQSRQCL